MTFSELLLAFLLVSVMENDVQCINNTLALFPFAVQFLSSGGGHAPLSINSITNPLKKSRGGDGNPR